MMKTPMVAIGAGLASALLFVVSAKGTAATTLVAYFTALPIAIAALGFGHLSGLLGAAIGSVAVGVAIGPVLAAFFAISFAFPSWWLAYLTLLAQPAGPPGGTLPAGGASGLSWYPIGRVVAWAAALASAAVLLAGAALLVRFGSYAGAVGALSHRIAEALGPASADTSLSRTFLIRILPLAMAASTFLMLLVNLWLGGRISELSQRLSRPWPNVPDGLRLPRGAAGLLVAATVLCLLLPTGAAALALATVATALGMAFALQGLATAHVLTRGFVARWAVMLLIYVIVVMVPVALLALAILGVVDCLSALRTRRPPTFPTPT